MGHVIKRRWSRREIYRCARCGRAGSLQSWKLEPATCVAVLARHDDRWVETPTIRVPMAPAERCSDDEDPFGHGGALDAEEASDASTQRQRKEHEVNKLLLGSGVVHRSHETWLLRGITFCGKCVAWGTSAQRLLTKACTNLPKTRASELKRLSKGLQPNRRTVWPSDTPVVPRRIYIDSDS